MTTALYTVWFLLPAFFFVMALWGKLEQVSDARKKENPGDSMRQGFFVLLCVGICILIDQYMLESLVEALLPDWFPLGFYRAILLPIVLVIAAMLIGPSKEIFVPGKKKPTVSIRKR